MVVSFPAVCSSPARIAHVSVRGELRLDRNFPVPILQAIGAGEMKVWPVRPAPWVTEHVFNFTTPQQALCACVGFWRDCHGLQLVGVCVRALGLKNPVDSRRDQVRFGHYRSLGPIKKQTA